MKHNKDIDRLFQEKFKDFEKNPREEVWCGIKRDLQKRKTRVIPLWLKLSGAAAILALALLVGKSMFFSDLSPVEGDINSKLTVSPLVSPSNDSSVDNTSAKPSATINAAADDSTASFESQTITPSTALASSQNKASEKTTTSTADSANSTAVKATSAITQTVVTTEKSTTHNNSIIPDKKAVKTPPNHFLKSPDKQEVSTGLAVNNQEANAIADTLKRAVKTAKIVQDETLNKETAEESKPSLFDEIAAQKALAATTTSEQDNSGRLSIRPNVAPIFYGSLDGGSAVDPKFANNSVQSEVTMAYGIDVAYAVSKRFKVRAGVSRVNMSYSTQDIAFSSAPQAATLMGVKHNKNIQNMVVVQGVVARQHETKYETNAIAPYTTGELNQQMEYIEVPVEVEYALLNERFGINLIGGVSTLFLSDDHVQINSQFGKTSLGESSNINNVSFTTNIGLGFDYDINKTLNFNIEPMFKYQLDAFSGATGNFKPYYFGIYTGLAFKF